MITPKDYEVLYYVTPVEYRYKLDGDMDPNSSINFEKVIHLEELISECSLFDYIRFLIKIYIEKYANPDYLFMASITWKDNQEGVPVQKDIYKMVFETVEYDPDNEEDYCGFLDNLLISFKEEVPKLSSIVESELHSKPHKKVTEGSFLIENSPISRIEIGLNTLQLFLDRKYYIDYRRF